MRIRRNRPREKITILNNSFSYVMCIVRLILFVLTLSRFNLLLKFTGDGILFRGIILVIFAETSDSLR